eukprot:1529693-Prymnesium_polylepis.1
MRCAALPGPPPLPPRTRRNNSLPVGFEPAASRSRSGIRTAMPIAPLATLPCVRLLYLFAVAVIKLCDSHARPPPRDRGRAGGGSLCAAGCSSASVGRARLCA